MAPEQPHDFTKKPQKFDLSSQGGLVFGGILAFGMLLLILLSLFSGPRDRGPRGFGQRNSQTQDEGLEMEKTLSTGTPEILEELDRIHEEFGTPGQVFYDDFPPEENIGKKISEELGSMDSDVFQQLRQGFSYQGEWSFDPQALENNKKILETYTSQRQRLREMLDLPGTKFEQNLVLAADGLKERLTPDDQSIDSYWGYMTLEESEVALYLENDDFQGAFEAVCYMLKFAALASHTKFPVMRTQAAFMREHSLRIFQRLVYDSRFGSNEMQIALNLFRKQLENWPRDSLCWIGDRASSLRVFELLRQGRFDHALEPEEQEELKHWNVFDKVLWMKSKEFNPDQAFYLTSMRRIIESCSRPYFRRLPVLSEIDDQIQSLYGTKQFPAISMLLLSGIREGMQTQAEDKARVEIWFLAFAVALERPFKEGALDPISGEPYRITQSLGQSQRKLIAVSSANGNHKAETYGK